jgi:hypothetical protein
MIVFDIKKKVLVGHFCYILIRCLTHSLFYLGLGVMLKIYDLV